MAESDKTCIKPSYEKIDDTLWPVCVYAAVSAKGRGEVLR